jgi:hypothetical protein
MDAETAAQAATRGTTRGQDAVTLALGTWLVVGVFADGWAHFTVPGLESFFTPWHAALYSGLAATAGWFVLLARPGLRAGGSPVTALPRGYRAGAAGVGLFGLGGLADMGWHQIFGVEAGIDALLSPTHLLLFAGGLLILTSPLRARWAGPLGGADRWVATGSATLAAALAAFALIYTSAFTQAAPVTPFLQLPEDHPAHDATELPVIAGMAGYLVTTGVLAVPLLFLLRRSSLPIGGPTMLTAVVAWLSVAVVDFPAVATAGALGATAGAAVADLLLARISTSAGVAHRWSLPVAGALIGLAVWSGQLTGMALAAGLAWPVELWSGIVLVAAALAGLLGALATAQAPIHSPGSSGGTTVERRAIAARRQPSTTVDSKTGGMTAESRR